MICPNCDHGLPKKTPVCMHCGTPRKDIEEASNLEAQAVLRKNLPEKKHIFHTRKWPDNLSYKKALLLCIFFGYLGLHSTYVGKFKQGLALKLCFGLSIVFSLVYYFRLSDRFVTLGGFFGAYCLMVWVLDIVRLAIKRYKVPVLLPERAWKFRQED